MSDPKTTEFLAASKTSPRIIVRRQDADLIIIPPKQLPDPANSVIALRFSAAPQIVFPQIAGVP